MNWKRMLDRTGSILSRWKNKSPVEEKDSAQAASYVFNLRIKKGANLPTNKIKELILQNPWSTVSQPPSIRFHSDRRGKVEIEFKVLNKSKGKLIEAEVRELLGNI